METKFRGQVVTTKEWVFGDLIHNIKGQGKTYIGNADWQGYAYKEVLPETVGQFTGLHDKEGTEAYGGDKDENGYVIEFMENNVYIENQGGYYITGWWLVEYNQYGYITYIKALENGKFRVIGNKWEEL